MRFAKSALLVLFFLLAISSPQFKNEIRAEDTHQGHKHGKEENSSNQEESSDPHGHVKEAGHADHEDEEENKGHDDHAARSEEGETEDHSGHTEEDGGHGGHEEEGGAAVGPEKGILEVSSKGFRLSPEALKSFELQVIKAQSIKSLPASAYVNIKDEKFFFRLKDGWYKRISVMAFNSGDEIVSSGAAFLRVCELITVEGAAHSH